MSLGWYGAVLFGHHVNMTLGRHNSFLSSHHATLIGTSLGRHGAIICGHHATIVGMTLGWHGTVLYALYTTIIDMSLVSNMETMLNLLACF